MGMCWGLGWDCERCSALLLSGRLWRAELLTEGVSGGWGKEYRAALRNRAPGGVRMCLPSGEVEPKVRTKELAPCWEDDCVVIICKRGSINEKGQESSWRLNPSFHCPTACGTPLLALQGSSGMLASVWSFAPATPGSYLFLFRTSITCGLQVFYRFVFPLRGKISQDWLTYLWTSSITQTLLCILSVLKKMIIEPNLHFHRKVHPTGFNKYEPYIIKYFMEFEYFKAPSIQSPNNSCKYLKERRKTYLIIQDTGFFFSDIQNILFSYFWKRYKIFQH